MRTSPFAACWHPNLAPKGYKVCKGLVFLAPDTTPGYLDTCPRPATPAKWTYRAIYRVNDAPVGQWSAPVSVAMAA